MRRRPGGAAGPSSCIEHSPSAHSTPAVAPPSPGTGVKWMSQASWTPDWGKLIRWRAARTVSPARARA
jgi:hypothetical protein